MSDLVIAPLARDSDLSDLCTLLRHFGGVFSLLSDHDIIEGYRAQTENYNFYGAYLCGVLIGAYALRFTRDPLDPVTYAFVNNLIVAPDHRHQGVGTKLLQDAAQRAKNAGAKTCLLHVEIANDSALRFYQGMGFQTVANLMAAQL